ncbi:hypothetical protein [Mycobacterium sp. 852002-40037_SCH5390672]|uniref:hypothetical protein n=1 Tax=Mycobacterium sp. 852002-40037_SCH5390672 TaxID=1834089 RepID=UPI0008050DBA|nr:hypothetical protein [Mycobacterium sp. 852002-40037_SCH5390672]OBB99764.1 hypothetical protein A5782_21735 [Mycobacterium sp. 852002-40037_SCH5390672]
MTCYHDRPQAEREDDEYQTIAYLPEARQFLVQLLDLLKRYNGLTTAIRYSGLIMAVHPDLRAEFWDQVSTEIQFWAVIFDEPGNVDHATIKTVVHEECDRAYDYERERGIA